MAFAQNSSSIFDWTVTFTERVTERSKEPLAGVEFLNRILMGMVFNVGQRLIDAKGKTGEEHPSDEALIVLCNRLFNDSFSGYLLCKRGLLGPASLLLRSALEVTNLAVLVGGRREHAERWLGGREYRPAEVRRLLESTNAARDWYRQLSKATHANYVASRASIYRVQSRNADILMYGGRFAPRDSGFTACAFLWLQLTLLNAFYARNSARLAELELLWKPEMLELLGKNDIDGLSWRQVLEMFASLLTKVQEELEALPPDHENIPPMVAQRLGVARQ